MSTSAVLGSSPESSRDVSPGVGSSPYLDRPIRPLPKRRLRERLSPEVAGSIQYPPALESTTPLFYYPYNPNDEPRRSGTFGDGPLRVGDREQADEAERNFIARRNGAAVERDDEATAYRNRVYSRQTSETSSQAYRYMQQLDAKYNNKPQPPDSAASSVDGYDSFENTNNKKKRKIPTPAMSNLAGGHLVNDLASMGISSHDDVFDAPQAAPLTYNTTPATPRSHGFSGPGRGSNLGNSRLSHRQRQPQWAAGGETPPGIISTAIANAERLPITPSRGQENVSLLQQQASKKISPASTQFTFTCDSSVPAPIPWPVSSMPVTPKGLGTKSVTTQATQTGSEMLPLSAPRAPPNDVAAMDSVANGGRPVTPIPKVRRRTAAKEYMLAARQRRQQQQYQNYHQPPALEDIWICEFCEYERIFGTPPEALIRQYEIKDRRVRKQEAERKRLLEKAKLKGRKGKKTKNSAATKSTAPHDAQSKSQHPHGPLADQDITSPDGTGTEGDEPGQDGTGIARHEARPMTTARPRPPASEMKAPPQSKTIAA